MHIDLLDPSLQDRGVLDPEALEDQLEERHPAPARLHEPHPEPRSRERDDDARQTPSGADVEAVRVRVLDAGDGAEAVEDVSLAQPGGIGVAHDPEGDGSRSKEVLEPLQPLERLRRNDEPEGIHGPSQSFGGGVFHVKQDLEGYPRGGSTPRKDTAPCVPFVPVERLDPGIEVRS